MSYMIASSIDDIVMELEREGSVYSLVEQGCIDESYLDEIIDSLSRLKIMSRRIHHNMENASSDVPRLLDCMASSEAAISMLEFHINQLTKGAGPKPADPRLIKQALKFVLNTLKPWISTASKSVWELIQKVTRLNNREIPGEPGSIAFGLAKPGVEISAR